MHEYETLFKRRNSDEEKVDGLTGWLWIDVDHGGWDGPKMDWETSHKKTIHKYCKKFDLAICAGGNQGLYPRLLSDHFRNVITFEPDPLNFFCLVANCQKDNIVKIQGALGAEHELVEMRRVAMDNTGMHEILISPAGYIPMFKVDDLKLRALDLLWLDLEGYEQKAVEGAINAIDQHRPLIMAERGHDNILNLIKDFGYREVCRSVSDTVYST
jgi:FkbM family methyltransferase